MMKSTGAAVQLGILRAGTALSPETREPLALFDSVAATTRWRRGQEICSEEGATDCWYRVVSGMAKRYAVRSSGRRQIVGLLLAGDMFGFPTRPEYCFTVDAVVEGTVVACYPRRRIELLAESDTRVARGLREMTFKAISSLQDQIFILGRTTSLKKVGSFLLRMADRLGDGRSDRITLPMSRYDIADYLGLSVETVSRCLTTLKQRGIIRLAGTRRLSIVDRAALEEGGGGRTMSDMRGTVAGFGDFGQERTARYAGRG
jgi:CRP/FNR family transcriptional regulator, nitrogen fixation regulation protein